MTDQFIVIVNGGKQYMSVKDISAWYGMSRPSVYAILKEMETSKRYGKITMNDCGDKLVDTLMLEDFLLHRSELKHPNIARRLPPYDPAEIRKRRGEYKIPLEEVI